MKTIKENQNWSGLEKSEYLIYLFAILILISILITFNFTSNNQLLEYRDFYKTGLSDQIIHHNKMTQPVNHPQTNIKEKSAPQVMSEIKQNPVQSKPSINQEIKEKNDRDKSMIPSINPNEKINKHRTKTIQEIKPFKQNNTTILYQIKNGDYLNKIAYQYQINIGALIKYNNIKDPNRILAGQYLKIPDLKR